MVLALAINAHATSWTSAKFPGEQNRAVQGCADDAQNPGDWFCIVVRCDQPGSPLSLHFSAAGPEIVGDVKLVIDENSFAVSVPPSRKSPLPLSTRAEALPYALVDAMKSGSMIRGLPSASAIQSNLIGELAQGHRTDRVAMCAAISRALLAAPHAQLKLLLIARSRRRTD
jgi:hypothetical protein